MDQSLQDRLMEELKSAGVYPEGPVSAWPEERNENLRVLLAKDLKGQPKAPEVVTNRRSAPEIKASLQQQARNLASSARTALVGGKVSAEVRNERYDTCKKCPAFRPNDKRCSECGCFMEAKTWLNGSPKQLCPLQKWSR